MGRGHCRDKRLKARLARCCPPADRSPDFLRRNNVSRARRAVGDCQYRKALQSLTSAGLAQPSQVVLDEMLAKRPSSCPPTLPTDSVPPPVQVSEAEVSRALKSFPNGSAPGSSGLRANHLKEVMFCPSPDRGFRVLHSYKVDKMFCVLGKYRKVSLHTSVAPPFSLARRTQSEALEFLMPLQLGLLCTQLRAALRTRVSPQKSVSSSLSTSPMRLIRFTALRCLEKLGNTLLVSQHGWNAVTEPNPFSIYLTTPSIVVAVFSRVTLWSLWVLPLLFTL